jgi:hypothetical protein
VLPSLSSCLLLDLPLGYDAAGSKHRPPAGSSGIALRSVLIQGEP